MSRKEIIALIENKRLKFPSLHDFEIVRISPNLINDEWVFKLEVNSEKDLQYEIEFSNVRNFICNGLYQQNIIDDVYINSHEALLENLGEYSNRLELHTEYHKDFFISEAIKNKLFIVELNPSVGVSLIIVCAKMTIYGNF